MRSIPFESCRAFLISGVVLLLLGGCALRLPPGLESPPHSVVVSSGGPNASAIYAARVDGGVILIDLGWWGAGDALEKGLTQLGAAAPDAIAVFLTHSHRDHIGAWRSVRHAPFYVAEPEVDLLFGRRQHGGWIA
ncbi:MAG: MBL fold metallo-hydrolase, partial [Longimicrobiales bacterium]